AGPGCITADGTNVWHWIIEGVILVAGVVYKCQRHVPMANDGDMGVVFATICGALNLALAINASAYLSPGTPVAAEIVPAIPGVMKWLRFKKVVEGTDGASLPGLAAVDTSFGVLGAFIAYNESAKQL